MKGFTAAYLGANIIIKRSEGDARYYLPPDYPYFIENDDLDSVKSCITKATEDFGGPRWLYACKQMKNMQQRFSHESILNEVSFMMDSLKAYKS